MKFIIIIFILPLFSIAETKVISNTKSEEPARWLCDGSIQIYNKNKEKDRWEEKASFKIEGPQKSNFIDAGDSDSRSVCELHV